MFRRQQQNERRDGTRPVQAVRATQQAGDSDGYITLDELRAK